LINQNFKPSLDFVHSGSSEDFINSLCYEAMNHKAVNHPYLKSLAAGEFKCTKTALREYAFQYSFYSSWFTKYLTGVINSLTKDEHKHELKHNLDEELGIGAHGDLENKPHVKIFSEFKESIGVNESYSLKNKPSTTVLIWRDLFLQKCSSDIVGVGLGAIGIATENIVSTIYSYIAEAIELHTDFPENSSLFFRLHIGCDDDHAESIINVTRDLADDISNREAIRFGVHSSLNLRSAFWDSQLARALNT
jgi:pyrroloquinoline quinone (PQQ) biosynthesis protein C